MPLKVSEDALKLFPKTKLDCVEAAKVRFELALGGEPPQLRPFSNVESAGVGDHVNWAWAVERATIQKASARRNVDGRFIRAGG